MKSRTLKIIAITILGLLLFIAIGTYLFLDNFVTNKVEYFLKNKLAKNIEFTYESMDLSTFTGTVTMKNIQINFKNEADSVLHTALTVDLLKLQDFSYLDYFYNEKIHFDKIVINENKLRYFTERYVASTDTASSNGPVKLFKSVQVDELKILKNKIAFYDNSKDSILLYVPSSNLIINDLYADRETISEKIPVTYSSILTNADSVLFKINAYEKLKINHMVANEKFVNLTDIAIEPNFSKNQLSKQLRAERDLMDVRIKQIQIQTFDFGFNGDRFYAKAPMLEIKKPIIKIYRDKLVPDDLTYKPLYSKMLREMTIGLLIDEVKVTDGAIVYEEKLKIDRPAGKLTFDNFYATISNLGNLQSKNAKSNIKMKADFQKVAPISLDWNFKVHDPSDSFVIKGTLGKTPANNLNSFTGPNLNVNFEGVLDATTFTISGNNYNSNTSMRMEYEDFKLLIMRKKDKTKVNRLLSGIANIFVDTNSKNQQQKYKEDSADATRNQNQSVFNFIWISMQACMIKILT